MSLKLALLAQTATGSVLYVGLVLGQRTFVIICDVRSCIGKLTDEVTGVTSKTNQPKGIHMQLSDPSIKKYIHHLVTK